ncbi:MAG: hypothetical protein UHM52_04140 [Acutalibacteraceae bacterium]|nr:hypothetical protein [Clostridia bacterium]MEE1188156.1 hypothetical protein [Acutalibacteraceae bacterium]
MEKKPIQAKNVVSFGDGKTINRPKPAAPAVEPVAEPVEASETVVKKAESGFIKAETPEAVEAAAETAAESVETAVDAVETEVANEVSEEVPLREVPEPEAIETKPLNLRQDRYLDETPQEPDWADEEDAFDDYEDDDETLSTFAEVFIPLHDDTTGAIVRKGLVIVSLIVILCCIVAIVMKQTGFSGVIMPDISALTDQAAAAASIALSNL